MKLYLSIFDLKSAIVRSVVALFIGVAFILFPTKVVDILVQILGGAIIITSLVSFLSRHIKKSDMKVTTLAVLYLIVFLTIGLLLIIKPSFFSNVAIICFGVILGFAGIIQLAALSGAKRIGVPATWYSYTFAIIVIGVGVAICFNPFESKETLIRLLGAGLAFYAITDLIEQFFFRWTLKQQGKRLIDGEIYQEVDSQEQEHGEREREREPESTPKNPNLEDTDDISKKS